MPKMPNRHFQCIQNGIDGKYFSILTQLITTTDDANAEKPVLFTFKAEIQRGCLKK